MNTYDLIQPIKEKIRDTFASLIPEEKWEEIIKTEVNNFFKKGYDSNSYNRPSNTNFELEVQRLLKEETDLKVKEYFSTNFNDIWYNNDGTIKCATIVEEIITKNAGSILADMIGGAISMRLQQAGFNTGY